MAAEHPGSQEWCCNTCLHADYAVLLLSVRMRPDAEKQDLFHVLNSIEIGLKEVEDQNLSHVLESVEIEIDLKKVEDEKKQS